MKKLIQSLLVFATITATLSVANARGYDRFFYLGAKDIYKTDGHSYCWVPSMEVYWKMTNQHPETLRHRSFLPPHQIDDGTCVLLARERRGSRVSEGVFTDGYGDIYYSNGSHYCSYRSQRHFQRITGSYLRAYQLPLIRLDRVRMHHDGICRG